MPPAVQSEETPDEVSGVGRGRMREEDGKGDGKDALGHGIGFRCHPVGGIGHLVRLD